MSSRTSGPRAKKAEMNPIKRHYAKPTRKTAMNAMCAYCQECTCVEQGNGREDRLMQGFRKDIRNCPVTNCPLWEFRPYQKSDNKQQKDTG
jgi:hypothetical protein